MSGNDYSAQGIRAEIQRTTERGESIRDWWESAHVRDHKVWLTGSGGNEVWTRLDVEDGLRPGVKVLNIGVGMGVCTRELVARGCDVHVLDISQAALDRVADVVAHRHRADTAMLPGAYFDFALSHLVAQHMLNVDLVRQIAMVLPALSPRGVFAIQYATSMEAQPPEHSELAAKGGSIQRSEASFAALVEEAGGKLVRSIRREQFPDHRAGWQVAHIGRR